MFKEPMKGLRVIEAGAEKAESQELRRIGLIRRKNSMIQKNTISTKL